MRFLHGLADVVRWPFERVAWSLERGVLWPLRERFAGRGPSRRIVGAGALAAVAGAAILAGVLLRPGDEAPSEQVAVATPTAQTVTAPPPEATQKGGSTLHGVPPSFGVGRAVGVSKASGGESADAKPGAPATAEPKASSTAATPLEAGATASTSSTKPVPAGPAAMKVARRFSEAFVFYEIGKRPAQAKAVFGETATSQLATALDERPPRLPSGAAVPKARVVNLVPGPRVGKAYTVSVSLLRVGVTSELRLTLREEKGGKWNVVQVLG